MPPRPNRATIRYRSMRTVPGENPPLCGGRDLRGTGGPPAAPPGSKVGVSRMGMARPQEGHKRAFSEHNAPQAEQVIMLADCIPLRREVVKPYWSDSTRQLGNGVQLVVYALLLEVKLLLSSPQSALWGSSIGACRRGWMTADPEVISVKAPDALVFHKR